MHIHRSDLVYMRGSGDGRAVVYSHDLAHLRGGGIGSLFAKLFSNVVPVVRRVIGVGAKVGKKL